MPKEARTEEKVNAATEMALTGFSKEEVRKAIVTDLVTIFTSGDSEVLMADVKKQLGEEKYEEFRRAVHSIVAPTTTRKIFTASWGSGYKGKANVALTALGAATALALACEIAGKISGHEELRLFSAIANALQ